MTLSCTKAMKIIVYVSQFSFLIQMEIVTGWIEHVICMEHVVNGISKYKHAYVCHPSLANKNHAVEI